MQSLSHKIRFLTISVAALTLVITGFVFGSIEDSISKSFKVGPGGTLTLQTDIGSINVKAVESSTLEVEVLREVKTTSEKTAKEILDRFKIDFNQSGKDVFIKAEYERNGLGRFFDKIRNRLKVKYIVSVPRIYNVELKTSGGSISVDDLEGEVNTKTSGGSLQFNNIKGNILGRTSGGSIKIGEVEGTIDVHTSGGSISVKEVMGTIKARTSGGSVKAYISRQPSSNCRLTTSGGSITVYLAEDIRMNVDASTSGGHVSTEFPVIIKGKISKRALRAKINGGGPELFLHTSGGNIHLKKI